MDIQSPSLVNGIAHSPEAGGARALSDEAGFNRGLPGRAATGPGAARDRSARGCENARAQFSWIWKNQLRVDRAQMLQSLLPTLGTQAAHGDGHRQGGSRGLAQDAGFRTEGNASGHHADTTGSAQDRVTAVYSDASVRGAPVVQSALGLDPASPTNGIDFNGEIRNVSHRLEAVMQEIEIADFGHTSEIRSGNDPTQFRSAQPGPPKR